MKILILEDDVGLNEVMSDLLRMSGMEVVSALSLEEGKEMLNESFDILLSDMRLPDGDGYEFATWAKNEKLLPKHLFFFSGYNDYAEKDLLALGAERVFNKPQDLMELIEVLKNLK